MLTFSELPDVAPGDRVRRVRREVLRTIAITGVLAAITVLLAPQLIWLAYGSEFLDATAATRVAVIVAIPIAVEYLLIHALLVMQVRRRAFVIEVVSMVLFSALLALTIPTGSLVLVALASLVGHTFAMFFLFLAVNHYAGRTEPAEPVADSELRASP
jgi:O-antigen/teichoic acid export membrane protein